MEWGNSVGRFRRVDRHRESKVTALVFVERWEDCDEAKVDWMIRYGGNLPGTFYFVEAALMLPVIGRPSAWPDPVV
jgi:hypothetical protein